MCPHSRGYGLMHITVQVWLVRAAAGSPSLGETLSCVGAGCPGRIRISFFPWMAFLRVALRCRAILVAAAESRIM